MATAPEYLLQLKSLLPTGRAWPREPGTWLEKVLTFLSQEPARIDLQARSLFDEADPRTADLLLPDWERVLGIPDGCVPLAADKPSRRLAAHHKLSAQGGQSSAYFVGVAADLGFTATVVEYAPARLGDRLGQRCYGVSWQFTWKLSVSASTGAFDHSVLECVIGRISPAHTSVFFGYP